MNTDPLLRLIVEESALGRPLSQEQLDEILARKVLSGGTLDSALLELGLVTEGGALALLGRAYDGPTADRAQLAAATPAAAAVLPRRIAEAHGFVPLQLSGRKLLMACRVPEAPAAFAANLEELGFALSLYLKPVWTTEALAAWGLHRIYGTPIAPRLQALLAAPAPRTPPPPGPAGMAPEEPQFDIDFSAPDESGWAARQPPRTAAAPVFVGIGDRDDSGWSIPATGDAVLAPDGATSPKLELIVDGTVPHDGAPAERLRAHLARLADEDESRLARRRTKVLWTVDDAIAELALCETRDELLEVALRFAWRRLHTAAIVVRQGPSLVVWDVLDPLLLGDELRRFPLPADGDHALARALALKSPVLGPVDADDPLCRLLGRTPRAILIVPILVGDRVLGAVVGDNGDRAVPPAALAELHMVVPRLGKALGNLILRARKGDAAAVPLAAPVEPSRDAPFFIDIDLGLDDASPTSTTTPTTNAATTPVTNAATKTAEAAPTTAAAASAGEATTPKTATPTTQAAEDDSGVPPSPGARGRESLLLATWRAWLRLDDDDLDELVSALAVEGDAARAAAQRLLSAGLRALPALARGFPGVLVEHPFEGPSRSLRDLRPPTPSSYAGVLLRLGADAVAPILVGELDHPDRLHRFAAVGLLALMDVPAALPRLAQRAFDAEPRIAALALEVLARQKDAPGFGSVAARLRDLVRRGDDFERIRAIRAVAALHDTEAAGVLIDVLPLRPKELAEEARLALVEITRQDFGTAERRWRAWLADHGHEPRRRWLLAGLQHKDITIRRAAADELSDSGVALRDFRADAPQSERDAAVAAIAAALGEAPP